MDEHSGVRHGGSAATRWLAMWVVLLGIAAWFGWAYASGLRHTGIVYRPDPRNPEMRLVEARSEETAEFWSELRVPGAGWVKEGEFVQRDRSDRKLAQGTYRNGKRHGVWTFWKENGSIDGERSGAYEDDVLVHGTPSPKGDFDPDPEPFGYTNR